MKKLKKLFWRKFNQGKIKQANQIRKQIEQLEIDKEINK